MNDKIDSSAEPDDTSTNRGEVLRELEKREHDVAYTIRGRRFTFIIGVLLVVAGVIFWVQTEPIAELFIYGEFDRDRSSHVDTATNVRWFGSFFVLISTVFFSYLYMVNFNPVQGREVSASRLSESDGTRDRLTIVSLLRSIDESIERGKIESVLSETERSEIIQKVSETIETQLNDLLLQRIDQKYGSVIVNDRLSNQAADSLGATTARLKAYAQGLQSKATVNLAYGIGSTVVAIMVLMYLLFNATPPAESSSASTAFFFVSRLLLVVLVQGIAIFFLNLYKATLRDILYLNNEITNNESKRTSLTLAIKGGNDVAAKDILLSLANTERNFVLKKGETAALSESSTQRASGPVPESVIKEALAKLMANSK